MERAALQAKYQSTPPENRNERGTLVLLLGRELNSTQDFDFLRQVVTEPPCTDLRNCHAGQSEGRHAEAHTHAHEAAGAGEIEITLEYPQIVAIKALEAYLSHHPKTPLVSELLTEAIHSKNPIASNLALTLSRKY